jgi:hypothetical protein
MPPKMRKRWIRKNTEVLKEIGAEAYGGMICERAGGRASIVSEMHSVDEKMDVDGASLKLGKCGRYFRKCRLTHFVAQTLFECPRRPYLHLWIPPLSSRLSRPLHVSSRTPYIPQPRLENSRTPPSRPRCPSQRNQSSLRRHDIPLNRRHVIRTKTWRSVRQAKRIRRGAGRPTQTAVFFSARASTVIGVLRARWMSMKITSAGATRRLIKWVLASASPRRSVWVTPSKLRSLSHIRGCLRLF